MHDCVRDLVCDSPKGNDLTESIDARPGVSVSCTDHALEGVPFVAKESAYLGIAIKNHDYACKYTFGTGEPKFYEVSSNRDIYVGFR